MDKFDSSVVRAEGVLVCEFLRGEIDTVRSCVNESTEKGELLEGDKRLLSSLIETHDWVADVTENEELKSRVLGDTRTYQITLTEDQFLSLANLSVTLHENLDGLQEIKDFESEDISVAEAVDDGFDGLSAVLGQIDW